MPNLFNAVRNLEQFYQTPALPEFQKQFILSILEGNEARASLNNIVTYRKKEDLLELKKSVQLMIKDTPSNKVNSNFLKRLKNLLRDIESMQKFEDVLSDFSNKAPKAYQKYLKLFDSLYQTTKQHFKGTLMIPIMQGLDTRLANSTGECFGYVSEWAVQLHLKNKFMGVSINGEPPFNSIPVNSKTWSKYPDVNHLAFLTPNISHQQSIQHNEFFHSLF